MSARLAVGLARRPLRPLRRTARLISEGARVVVGRSELEPARGDRRFADPAWDGNAALRRLKQGYLAWSGEIRGLVDDAELGWQDETRARFAVDTIVDAVAPTNFPWLNPEVVKESLDRGGENLGFGARRAIRDLGARRLPATVDRSRFAVGENLAASPGSVVFRSELFELIQYEPKAGQVHEVPLLIIPPTINRYYVLDLAPGRSLVEHLTAAGQQVFMISWANPEREHGHHDLDAYVAAVLEARDVVAEVAGNESVGLQAVCSGGMLAACAASDLAARGALRESVAHLGLAVCLLDVARAGTSQAMVSRQVAAAAVAESARRGYVEGEALATVFAWLRPNDLIWSYVITNYYLGKEPPAFDILYWNQDTVRLAAGLHKDFMKLALENPLTTPGKLELLGRPIDLSTIDVPSYVVGAKRDHIVPWQSTWRSARLLGGDVRYVLSASGHIQAIVNPPGENSRSSFGAADRLGDDPDRWANEVPRSQGSWWNDYAEWVGERSGALIDTPDQLGSATHPAAARAPGSFVHAA